MPTVVAVCLLYKCWDANTPVGAFTLKEKDHLHLCLACIWELLLPGGSILV